MKYTHPYIYAKVWDAFLAPPGIYIPAQKKLEES